MLKKGMRPLRRVLIKSRNRIYGRKATKQEITDEIAKMAAAGLPVLEIAEQSGKARTTVWRYLKEAEKRGLIEKTKTGRVKLSEQVLEEKEYARLELDDFVSKYPAVGTWVNDMRTRKDGKPIRMWKSMLSHLKTVCDTLKVPPSAVIAGPDNHARIQSCRRVLQEFALAVQKGHVKYAMGNKPENGVGKNRRKGMSEAGFHGYRMAVRNFAMSNGVSFPRGMSGLLSGKKVGYGRYAHVKLPFEKIDELVQYLGKKYGYASREQAAFVFYYLTCARNQSGARVRLSNFVTHRGGWVTCRVFESKTSTPWTKYLPADNPHQKVFLDYLKARNGSRSSSSGSSKYLFIDREEEARKFSAYITAVFKMAYRDCGIEEEYFYTHPVHALRHVGAHYWLARPEVSYNHTLVAKVGGWKSPQTLIDCYGELPEEFVIQKLAGTVQAR
jgi:predicted transcriptional regulator